uniref:Ig-like domain-containing protein n=1 Tax=Cyprinus carpio TaxID=7962 RepID=A0A8C1M4T4_CYPCA
LGISIISPCFMLNYLISYNSADECIVGVIGERAILPCVYNGVKNLTLLHISSEWKRGMEIIHTAVWMEGKVKMQNVSHSIRTTVSSLLLGQNRSSLVCTVCLTIAANGVYGEETRLLCNSLGGFPAPSIYWLVNHTQRPPETSVTTYMNTLPKSELYNITTVLSINISADTAVSCVIENKLLNETLTATNYYAIFACGQLVFCQVLLRDGCQSTCGSSALLCVWLFSCWWLRLYVTKRNGTEIRKESNTDVEVLRSCLFTDLTV